MLDILNEVYTLNGVAYDEETLFRIRQQLVGYCYEDMFNKGYQPIEGTMQLDYFVRRDGKVSYTVIWRCEPIGI